MVSAARGFAGAPALVVTILAACLALGGCGPEVVGAAATGAATSAAQLKQAQDDKARTLKRFEEADKAQQERLKEMDREVDSNAK